MARLFADLRRRISAPRQERAPRRAEAMLAERALAELRRSRGVTQDALASELRIRQAAVSKLEGRDDLLLSTLAAYVRALGGTLEVVARFRERSVRLDSGSVAAKPRLGSSIASAARARKR